MNRVQVQDVDETLVTMKRVERIEDSPDGLGFDVDLACGHKVWHAVRPGAAVYCGMCLSRFTNQVFGLQKPRD